MQLLQEAAQQLNGTHDSGVNSNHEPFTTQSAITKKQTYNNTSDAEFTQTLLKQGQKIANEMNCEGRFHLTIDELKNIDPKQHFSHIHTHLEKAWEIAYPNDHRTVVAIQHKDKKLQEYQNWYYQQTHQNPESLTSKLFITEFEKIAGDDKKSGQNAIIYNNEQWTYKQLNEKANQLAHSLLKYNWPKETRIALFFENSPEAVVSILAIMKAGLAYVPLTVHDQLPVDRLSYYLKDSEAKMIITQDKLLNHDFVNSVKKEFTELLVKPFKEAIGEKQNSDNLPSTKEIKPDQLAYILYSSGSTGKPKGVKTAHRGLYAPVEAVSKAFSQNPEETADKQFGGLNANDIIGWHSLLTFDASLLDIMTALGNGLPLVIIPQDIRTDPQKLEKYMDDNNVTILTLVPSVIDILHPENLPKLRGFLSVGERARKYQFEKWYNTGRTNSLPRILINGFGHTEASMCTSLGRYVQGEILHIGSEPIAGLEWLVLSLPSENDPYPRAPKLVKDDEEGELYLIGNNLALGYVDKNSPQRFRAIPHPDPQHAGEILWVYQTGDKVKRTKDNKHIFIDRVDNQCKYLGELIHPAEIEQSIKNFQNDKVFKDAQLIVEGNEEIQDNNDQSKATQDPKTFLPILHAYVELHELDENKKALVPNEKLFRDLHYYLLRFHYLTPSRYSIVKKDQWPKNQSGKIDRKTLSKNKFEIFFINPIFKHPPTDKIEEDIINIWYKVLWLPKEKLTLTLDHNFYDLGGRSIHTSQMLTKVNQLYSHYNIDFAQFNAWPTIRALAFRVRNSDPKIKKILHRVKWQHGEQLFQQSVKNNRYPIILINAVSGDASKDYKNILSCWLEKMSEWPLLYTQSLSLQNPGYIVHSPNIIAFDYIVSINADNTLKNYTGPIILIGYSAGGTLAVEITNQMQKLNRQVAVICVDAESPTYYDNLSSSEYANEIINLMLVMSKAMNIDENAMRNIISIEELQKFPKKKQLATFWQKFMEKHAEDLKERQNEYLGFYATFHISTQTQFAYIPEPIDNGFLITLSETRKKCKNDHLGWGNKLRIEDGKIEGEHLAIVKDLSFVRDSLMPQIKKMCNYASNQIIMSPIIRKEKSSYSDSTHSAFKFYIDNKIVTVGLDDCFINLNYHLLNTHQQQTNNLVLSNEEQILKIYDLIPEKPFQPYKILITGRPGIGKQTLCRYIANQWAKGKLWDKNVFDIVLWIKLEDFNSADNTHRLYFINKIINTYTGNILLLISGYDKIQSFETAKIVSIILSNILNSKNCSCIATISTLLFNELNNLSNFDKQLELVGFDQKNIEKYVEIFFNKINKKCRSELLVNYINNENKLKDFSRVPQNLSLLCQWWSLQNDKTELDITDLLKYIISKLLKIYFDRLKVAKSNTIANEDILRSQERVQNLLMQLAAHAWPNSTIIKKDLENKINLWYRENHRSDIGNERLNEFIKDLLHSGFIYGTDRDTNGDLSEYHFFLPHAIEHLTVLYLEKHPPAENSTDYNTYQPLIKKYSSLYNAIKTESENSLKRDNIFNRDKATDELVLKKIFDVIIEQSLDVVRNQLEDISQRDKIDELAKTKNRSGKTILHVAALRGDLAIIEEILSYVDSRIPDDDNNEFIHAVDNNHKTAMQLAEEKKHMKIAAFLRTRQEMQDQDKFKNIFINRMIKLIEECYEAAKSGINKDLVMFIGNTGSGKSTLINYLMGVHYVKAKVKTKNYAKFKEGDVEFVKSGHGKISITLYPHVIENPQLNCALCDLAGLDDNRGTEERICAASSTQMLSHNARHIKSIILVIDYNNLTTDRGATFRKAALALSNILRRDNKSDPDYTLVPKCVYFIITKAESDVTIQDVCEEIKEILIGLKAKSHKTKLSDEEKPLMDTLEVMLKNPSRIIIPNIFDNGESIEIIKEALTKSVPQSPTNFNFTNHDIDQAQFNGLMKHLAESYVSYSNKLNLIPSTIEETNEQIKKENNDIKKWHKEKDDKKRQKQQALYDPNKLRDEKDENDEQIAENNRKIDMFQRSNEANELKIIQLDKDKATYIKEPLHKLDYEFDHVHHAQYDHKNKRYRTHSEAVFFPENVTFAYPIRHVKTTFTGGGSFKSGKRDNPVPGDIGQSLHEYWARYSFEKGKDGSVNVKFYTWTYDYYKDEISKIDAGIASCNKKIAENHNEMTQLQLSNENLVKRRKEKKAALEQGAISTDLRDKKLDEEINEINDKLIPQTLKKIEELKQSVIAMKKDRDTWRLELEVNQSLYQAAFNIAQKLGFEDDIFKSFYNCFENNAKNSYASNQTLSKENTEKQKSLLSIQQLSTLFIEDKILSNIELTKEDIWATDTGIEHALNYYLKDVAHIIQPSLSSITSPFDSDPDKANAALINYAKAIFGYFDNNNVHQKNGFVAEDGGALSKPIVMVINNCSVKPQSATDTLAIGGSHWVTCIILPRHYKILNKEYSFYTEQIYFIDSLYENKKLPDAFKNIFLNELTYQDQRDPSKEEIIKNPELAQKTITYSHKIKPTFISPKFIDLVDIPQQVGGSDCGYWAVYNALMVVLTGSGDYTKNFTNPRTRDFGLKLRTLFSNLACDFTLKNTISIKEFSGQMFHKPAPKQVLTNEQILLNIAITKNELEKKQPQAQAIQPTPSLLKHPV